MTEISKDLMKEEWIEILYSYIIRYLKKNLISLS